MGALRRSVIWAFGNRHTIRIFEKLIGDRLQSGRHSQGFGHIELLAFIASESNCLEECVEKLLNGPRGRGEGEMGRTAT